MYQFWVGEKPFSVIDKDMFSFIFIYFPVYVIIQTSMLII